MTTAAWRLDGVTALARTSGLNSTLDGGMFATVGAWNKLAVMVWENKGGAASTVVATAQAAAYASGVAMSLLKLGVESDEIMVPVVTCNGLHLRFGATITLEPSFPVYVPLSRDLDLSDEGDTVTAAE